MRMVKSIRVFLSVRVSVTDVMFELTQTDKPKLQQAHTHTHTVASMYTRSDVCVSVFFFFFFFSHGRWQTCAGCSQKCVFSWSFLAGPQFVFHIFSGRGGEPSVNNQHVDLCSYQFLPLRLRTPLKRSLYCPVALYLFIIHFFMSVTREKKVEGCRDFCRLALFQSLPLHMNTNQSHSNAVSSLRPADGWLFSCLVVSTGGHGRGSTND